VTINFDVLGAFMKDLIGHYLKGIFVVTVQGCRLGEEDVNPERGKTTIVAHM